MKEGKPIHIVARVRPPIHGEICDDSVKVQTRDERQVIAVNNPRDPSQVFEFP